MGSTYIGRQLLDFPSEVRLFKGQEQKLSLHMPVTASALISNPDIVHVNGSPLLSVPVDLQRPISLKTHKVGKTNLTLKLFGTLPITKVNVRVMPKLEVIPGGQSIGVKLKSKGVLVVGHHLVHNSSNKVQHADIRVGDYLVSLNGKPVSEVKDVADVVEKAGRSNKFLEIALLREGKSRKVTLRPVFDKKEHAYRLGVFIRDSAAGVGTLTFFDPKHKVYGALGHMITDIDTGQTFKVRQGTVCHSSVTSIQKGESGEPGEKRAIFFQEGKILGNITKNTPFGIFGSMQKFPDNSYQLKPVPVALGEQVKKGPAKILTVINGQKVQAFDIKITHVLHQKYPATKGLVIKVTDPRLLSKTGGIVQGMSGSPILQGGKLVGAVTHVFVNDPTSGYGTFIEWMLQDAGALNNSAAGAQLGTPAVYINRLYTGSPFKKGDNIMHYLIKGRCSSCIHVGVQMHIAHHTHTFHRGFFSVATEEIL